MMAWTVTIFISTLAVLVPLNSLALRDETHDDKADASQAMAVSMEPKGFKKVNTHGSSSEARTSSDDKHLPAAFVQLQDHSMDVEELDGSEESDRKLGWGSRRKDEKDGPKGSFGHAHGSCSKEEQSVGAPLCFPNTGEKTIVAQGDKVVMAIANIHQAYIDPNDVTDGFDDSRRGAEVTIPVGSVGVVKKFLDMSPDPKGRVALIDMQINLGYDKNSSSPSHHDRGRKTIRGGILVQQNDFWSLLRVQKLEPKEGKYFQSFRSHACEGWCLKCKREDGGVLLDKKIWIDRAMAAEHYGGGCMFQFDCLNDAPRQFYNDAVNLAEMVRSAGDPLKLSFEELDDLCAVCGYRADSNYGSEDKDAFARKLYSEGSSSAQRGKCFEKDI